MAESRVEQIISAIKTKLETIVGDGGTTYWHTYHVIRYHAMTAEILDPSIERPIAVVIPDVVESEEDTNRQIRKFVRFDIVGTKKHQLPARPFDATAPNRWIVQNRIAQDVEKKLREDVTLGGLTDNLEITLTDETAETTYIDGWATVMMNCVAQTVHSASTP